jgi:hypothetical protein
MAVSADKASSTVLTANCTSPLRLRPRENVPAQVDYSNHPAYADFIRIAGVKRRLSSLLVFARFFSMVTYKRLFSYELLPRELRKPKSIAALIKLIVHRLRTLGMGRRAPAAALPGTAAAALHARLQSDGVAVFQLTRAQLEAIDLAGEEIFSRLRQRRGSKEGLRDFMESRMEAAQAVHRQLYDAVDEAFESSGLMAAVGRYLGRSARLVDVNPQINDQTDDFWSRIFDDLDIELPATAYLHKDASGGDIKAMIYLSDVGPNNGPFSFVVGSHAERPGRLDDWIAETNDHSGMSSTARHARAAFAALPRRLRQKCAFGNDVVDRALCERLSRAEWNIEAPRGSVVAFDTKGFHRGGMVASGERAVITCVLG